MRKTKGIALIILSVLLCGVIIVMLRVQWNSPVDHWLNAISGLLLSFGLALDVGVLSLCACAALISGLLFLTSDSSKPVGVGWQFVWFLLHSAAVYTIVLSCTPRLAGWISSSLAICERSHVVE